MELKTVQTYECSVCGKLSKDAEKITECQKKCDGIARKALIEKKRTENWAAKMDKVRLEAETLEDVQRLLVLYSKEFFKAELKFTTFSLSFRQVSTSHDGPVTVPYNEKPKESPGFSGRVEGEINFPKGYVKINGEEFDGFSDLMGSWHKKGFRGMFTGTGSGGKHFQFEFRFFLVDFPKMQAKYAEFEALQAKQQAYKDYCSQKELADSATATQNGQSDEILVKHVEMLERNNYVQLVATKAIEQRRKEIEKRRKELFHLATANSKIPVIEPDFDVAEYERLARSYKRDRW